MCAPDYPVEIRSRCFRDCPNIPRVMSCHSDNADSTFFLEPALEESRRLLTEPWRDVDVIAEHLRNVVFGEALKLSRFGPQR